MSPSRPDHRRPHSTQRGRRVYPYLDCAQRQKPWGRTSLLHMQPPESSGQPGSRTSQLGRAGSCPAIWPQGRAGESLQVHTLWPLPGGLPDGDPQWPILGSRALHTSDCRLPGLLGHTVTWCAGAWTQLTAELRFIPHPYCQASLTSCCASAICPLLPTNFQPSASHYVGSGWMSRVSSVSFLGIPGPGFHFPPFQEPRVDLALLMLTCG